jgi:hypothetical protein
MKRCPKCNRTYQDDAQKFCTHDGGLLVADVQPTVAFDPNATIINEPPTETYSPPPPARTPPAVEDLNKTIAGTPQPFPTSDFARGETGPAVRPTSANLPQPPAQRGTQDFSAPLPPSPQPPPQPPPQQHAAPPAASAPLSGALPQQQQQQPARKKSRLPLILGILAVLLVLFVGLAAAAYFVVLPRILANTNANTNANRAANSNTSANTASTPPANVNANIAANENASPAANSNSTSSYVAPFVPPPGSAQFVNSSAKLDGKLAEHYVDFSFYYPRAWKADPKSGVAGASNFVKVERMLPPDYTQESFAVAWYTSDGTVEADRDKFPRLIETLDNFYKQFPEYHKVSEGATKINSYDGYEYRFESTSRDTPKGDIKLWGRIVFLPTGEAGAKNGVILVMLATSLAPELTSVSEVGEKGEMPLILDSFRFGKTR